GLGYEVGESSSAVAARLARGLRADYGFVATMDREIRRDLEREMSEIRELHAAERRRQTVTLEMLKADHRRSAEMRELRTGQQGPAGGLVQPELPEEAGSSS
ncbi:hypothetical protein Tco_0096360, partial [Tanacetum coccineum]